MSALVTARLTPCRTKNVPSVTMKLGSPVRMTRMPLIAPIATARTSDATIDTHTFMSYSVIKMPVVRPVVPIIAPADRSNSPPIISIATATAMMPNDEAVKIQVLAPARLGEGLGRQREEEEDDERADGCADLGPAQDSAESAWLTESLVAGWRAPRAPPGVFVRVLMVDSFGVGRARVGLRWARDRTRRRLAPTRARQRVPFLAYSRTSCSVVLGDDRRARVDRLAAADVVAVEQLQVDARDAQVALDVGLLVDRRTAPCRRGRPGRRGVQVERADLDVSCRRRRRPRLPHLPCRHRGSGCRRCCRPAAASHSIVDCEPCRSVLSACRFSMLAVEGRLGARAALLEADVSGLLDDADDVGQPAVVELLTGGLARRSSRSGRRG